MKYDTHSCKLQLLSISNSSVRYIDRRRMMTNSYQLSKPAITMFHSAWSHYSFEQVTLLQTPLTSYVKHPMLFLIYTWWRHQMEAVSALLAICAGNAPVIVDLRCHHTPYDVTVTKKDMACVPNTLLAMSYADFINILIWTMVSEA